MVVGDRLSAIKVFLEGHWRCVTTPVGLEAGGQEISVFSVPPW